jgi:N-acetylglucosamine malate deacetylase 2
MRASQVLAVCAHPDDESFGLGAVLARLAADGASLSLLCFTHGEASTLGLSAEALGPIRRRELTEAAAVLGMERVELLDHPDGALDRVPIERLAGEVADMVETVGADVVLVFDEGGVTGHPDHCRATEAALQGAPRLPVLAWSVPRPVAETLNAEHATSFVGRGDTEIDVTLTVDRDAQWRAIACHSSQSRDNPVLRRRLELLADREVLRWLRRPEPKTGGVGEMWDERYRSAPRLFRVEPDETLVGLVGGLAPGRAVDLGAGEGRNSLWLADAGWAVVAVDASTVALERLAASASSVAVRTVVADLSDYLAAGNTFDLVVLAYVHPPLEERSSLLRAAAGAVASGGHLFVVGHHLDSLGRAGPPDRDRLYTEEDLRRAASGLEVVRLERRVGHSDIAEPAVDVFLWAQRPG